MKLMVVPKNEHKENQCLKREQIIQGNKQLLLDIIIQNFVLFRCFLYKTYKCQELNTDFSKSDSQYSMHRYWVTATFA